MKQHKYENISLVGFRNIVQNTSLQNVQKTAKYNFIVYNFKLKFCQIMQKTLNTHRYNKFASMKKKKKKNLVK